MTGLEVKRPEMSGELPFGWELKTTPQGKVYYVNHVNKVTQWEWPTEEVLPEHWEKLYQPSGRAYYVNHETKVTQWTSPLSSYVPAAQATSAAPAITLIVPDGWEQRHTPSGKPYYVNHMTKETQWHAPTQDSVTSSPSIPPPIPPRADLSAPVEDLPDGWEVRRTKKGRKYYANTATQSTQWDKPTQSAYEPVAAPKPELTPQTFMASPSSPPCSAPPNRTNPWAKSPTNTPISPPKPIARQSTMTQSKPSKTLSAPLPSNTVHRKKLTQNVDIQNTNIRAGKVIPMYSQLDTPECSLDLVHDTVYDDHITTIPWTQRSALPDRTPDPPTTPQVKFSDKKTSQWSFANYLVRPPVEDTSAINEPLSLDCDTEYVNEPLVIDGDTSKYSADTRRLSPPPEFFCDFYIDLNIDYRLGEREILPEYEELVPYKDRSLGVPPPPRIPKLTLVSPPRRFERRPPLPKKPSFPPRPIVPANPALSFPKSPFQDLDSTEMLFKDL